VNPLSTSAVQRLRFILCGWIKFIINIMLSILTLGSNTVCSYEYTTHMMHVEYTGSRPKYDCCIGLVCCHILCDSWGMREAKNFKDNSCMGPTSMTKKYRPNTCHMAGNADFLRSCCWPFTAFIYLLQLSISYVTILW